MPTTDKRVSMIMLAILLAIAAPLWANQNLEKLHPGATAFIETMVSEHGFEPAEVEKWLALAKRRQDIIDAISRPAEAKPWYQYRPIFMTDRRLKDGLAFWDEHQATLDRVSSEYGVPQEVIVAIIGVETSYGRITGKYRVLDSLATLAFHYPPRSRFFTSELVQFLILAREENLDIATVKGSYAGAMGYGQFISSSYRHYAVDFNKDGRRNLWDPEEDAIASVANYFKQHGWKPGEPVTFRSEAAQGARKLEKPGLKPAYPLVQLAEWGYSVPEHLDPQTASTLITLEQQNSTDYWIGLHNFYVISRYNHSALYSMAVFQLSEQLKQHHEQS